MALVCGEEVYHKKLGLVLGSGKCLDTKSIKITNIIRYEEILVTVNNHIQNER